MPAVSPFKAFQGGRSLDNGVWGVRVRNQPNQPRSASPAIRSRLSFLSRRTVLHSDWEKEIVQVLARLHDRFGK